MRILGRNLTIILLLFLCSPLLGQQLYVGTSFGVRHLLGGDSPEIDLPNVEGLLVGLKLGMTVGDRFAIEIGGEFAQRQMYPEARFISDFESADGRIFRAGDDFFTRVEYEYAVIPLSLRYTIWQNDRYSLYVLVGANYHVKLRGGIQLDRVRLPFDVEFSDLPERYLTYSGGLGIDVPLVDQFRLHAETALENTANDGLLTMRLNLGVRYFFPGE